MAAKRITYSVVYRIEGEDNTRTLNVYVSDGYTDFGSIPRIIAVRHFSNNDPESVSKVIIISARMVAVRDLITPVV